MVTGALPSDTVAPGSKALEGCVGAGSTRDNVPSVCFIEISNIHLILDICLYLLKHLEVKLGSFEGR